MAHEFVLPEIGEGVVEGEIVEWHVSVGDAVGPDQQLVSVLTDKATVEIASDFAGTVTELVGEAGDVVAVGSALVRYDETAGATEEEPDREEPAAASAAPGEVADFVLPEIGEGVVEGEIVEWHVSVGDEVQPDQQLVSVLTDKATVEIASDFAGTITELVGEAGDVVAVGSALVRYSGGAAAPQRKSEPAREAPAPAARAEEPVPVVAGSGEVDPSENPSISAFGTPLATPAVRRMATEKGVDLRRVRGSGPNNRITRDDVSRVLSAPASAATDPRTPPTAQPTPVSEPEPAALPRRERETREKLRGLRKVIHAGMTRAKRTVPHFTYVEEIEMDAMVAMRGRLKQAAEEAGVKLTYLPFVAKAIVAALKKFPILNASVDDTTGEIVYKHYYNIGIATATENGLTVPVVKDVDRHTVLEVADAIHAVTARARQMKSTREDISDGTFTITSLGRIGGLFATPIINYPEVGILGIHNLQERAVVRDGAIVIRQMMNLSLSCDHRVVDGDVAANFVQEVKRFLEEPGRLMLQMV